MKNSETGTVLRIEKTSIHDGEGLRTVVYLKGCPLRCKWCSTPESQNSSIEMGFIPKLCNGCGTCVEICPEQALSMNQNGLIDLDRKLCNGCLDCIAHCLQGVFKSYGKKMTAIQVVDEISKDEIFYFFSGGGVTISGGECLLQVDFVKSILEKCVSRGINTTIETSLFAPWDDILKLLPYLNSIYVDIKHCDSHSHKKITGVGNKLIQENLRKIDRLEKWLPIFIRVPLIPGINDSDQSLSSVLAFVSKLKKVQSIEILPYHRLGVSTYDHLQQQYPLKELRLPSKEYILERVDFLRQQNSNNRIKIGGVY